MDCEMVECEPDNSWLANTKTKRKNPSRVSIAARCAIVDYDGNVLYDSFICPNLRVTDWRTSISGITAIAVNNATPFNEARLKILDILRDKLVVANDIRHDLSSLQIDLPSKDIRDTSTCQILRELAGVPYEQQFASLQDLAKGVLNYEVQNTMQHNPIEDARVAMKLYRFVEDKWEKAERREE